MDDRAQSLAQRVLLIAKQREEGGYTGFLLYSELPRELLRAFTGYSEAGDADEGAYGLLADALYQVTSNETRRGGRFKDNIGNLQELLRVLGQSANALSDALMGETTRAAALAGVLKVMQRRSFIKESDERVARAWVRGHGSQAQSRVERILNAAIEVDRPFH